MTGQTAHNPGEGEQSERRYWRRFWLVLGGIALGAMPVGGVFGFMLAQHGFDFGATVDAMSPIVLTAMALAYAGTVLVGTWLFTRVIDEVELADNLWGSAAGFYFYGLGFPCWWLLWKAGWMAEPNDWVLFAATFGVGCAAYAWRKISRA